MSIAVMRRSEAITLGLKKYFSGEPCVRGHLMERDVSSRACPECRRLRDLEAYARNPTKKRDDAKKWAKANPDRKKTNMRSWKASNPTANADWFASHPGYNANKSRTRRARVRGVEGNHTVQQIADLLVVQRGRCAICRRDIRKTFHADHVVPIKTGGSNYISNIQLLCPPCNQSKGAKDPIVFMQSLGRLI